MSAPRDTDIEVVYADAARILVANITWQAELTARAAIAAAPEIAALGDELAACGLAIWGARVLPEQLLQPGDRLEIMPPLPNDPKLARRQRVVEARARTRTDAARARKRH